MSKKFTYFSSQLSVKLFTNFKLVITICLLTVASFANAQIVGCTGNLGKPLVTIDFGTGTTNVSADPAIMKTTYTPANWGTVSDGGYTISSNPVQNSGWHSGKDHTGNTNGRMLIVNADVAPGIFAEISVKDLCPQTNFEFSAWIAHLSMVSWCDGDSLTPNGEGPFKPVNVKFIIESKTGTVIKQGTTGDINVNRKGDIKWNNFALSFNTGNNTDVVLKLQNNGKGGCGNDLAIDDISFAPCGPKLTFTPENACSDQIFEIMVKGAKSQYAKPAYQWQKSTDNGSSWSNEGAPTTDSILKTKIVNPGTNPMFVLYRIYVAADTSSLRNSRCSVLAGPFSVKIFPSPQADFKFDVPYCVNGAVKFTATGNTADIKSYNWTFQDGNPATATSKDVTVTWLKPGKHAITLSITDINGCISNKKSGQDTILINEKPKLDLNSSNNFLFCIGKKVSLFATKDKYTYEWFKNGVKIPGADSATYEASTNGLYKVLVKDANGCFRDTAIVVKSADSLNTTQSTLNNVTCNGKNDGSAWVKIKIKNNTVDTSNYTYNWAPNGGNANKAIDLSPGKYKVYITDKKTGCMDTAAVVITEPDPLSTSASVKNLNCFNDSDGAVKVTPAGGTPQYKYEWKTNPVQTSQQINNLKAGSYEVLITDANNCTITRSFVVTQTPFPPDEDTIRANFCEGDSIIVLYAKKGVGPYQWYENGIEVKGETADYYRVKNLNKTITVTWIRNGCRHRSSQQLLNLPVQLFLPEIGTSIFTPNGDGHSDAFYPFSSGFNPNQIDYYAKEYSLKVFDRWGKKVFETTDYATGWDGNYSGGQATAGVYYWMTTYTSRCGSSEKKNTGKGFVHLMR